MARTAFELEYVVRSSIPILYKFLTTPSGLAQWFADEVDINEGVYSFNWEGSSEEAELLDEEEDEFVRYRWMESDDDEYFEFKIGRSEVTGDTILYITDFEDERFVEDQERFWDSQIKQLRQQIGG